MESLNCNPSRYDHVIRFACDSWQNDLDDEPIHWTRRAVRAGSVSPCRPDYWVLGDVCVYSHVGVDSEIDIG